MNTKLEAIANEAAANLMALIKESEDKLLEAWNACEAEAQEQESKPKFKMGLAITLDLDADAMITDLTFGVRHKLSRSQSIPDPDQQKLPGIDSMTISTPGTASVTLTAKDLKALSKAAKGMN